MKCKTPDCNKKAEPHRKLCASCKKNKYIKKYPLKYLFMVRRNNAKRRGKIWTLTFEEFKEFCEKTGYDKTRGKYASDFSIDRINPELGYSIENIRSITVSDNSKLIRGSLPPDWEPEESNIPF